jgi:Carboxypeptidase regulatory-like domain
MKRKAIITLLISAFTFINLFNDLSAQATPSSVSGIAGVVVGNTNQSLAGVVITASQNGVTVQKATSASDGTYSLPLSTGNYSLKFVPPTNTNSTLYAYDIAAPQAQSLRVMLTTPTPGRAFVAGNLSLSDGEQLASDTYVAFGNVGGDSELINSNGDYRLTPTAGTSGAWHIKGDTNGTGWQFELFGQSTAPINQDELANFVVPMATQRVHVVSANGAAVPNTQLQAGVGEFGMANGTLAPFEGLGVFTGRWFYTVTTDANGWANIPMIAMASPTQGEIQAVPSVASGFGVQVYKPVFGAGDLTLTLTNQNFLLNGSVKDSSGVAIDQTQVMFGSTLSTVSSNGSYSMTQPNGTVSNYGFIYHGDGTNHPNFAFQMFNTTDTFLLTAPLARNFVIPTQSTKVRVLNGATPVVGASVTIIVGGSQPNGSLTLTPGRKPFSTYVMGQGVTDSTGTTLVPGIHLDAALPATVTVTPTSASGLAPFTSIQTVGLGADLNISVPIPSVTISGHVSYSDGTSLVNPYVSFQDGKGNGAGVQSDNSSNYSFSVAKGFAGYWSIGCRIQPVVHDPLCVTITNNSSVSYTADTTQNFVIPTYKTPVKVVDPSGKGISGVQVSVVVGTTAPGNYPPGQINLIPGQPSYNVNSQAVATTDSNGLAQVPTVNFLASRPAYVLITPPPTSRYITRNVAITVGDNSQNVIVLTIPKPVINTITYSSVGGIKVATVIGDNLLGAFSVVAGKTTINNFTVVDVNHLTFVVPSGLSFTSLTITNGGGSTTWGS